MLINGPSIFQYLQMLPNIGDLHDNIAMELLDFSECFCIFEHHPLEFEKFGRCIPLFFPTRTASSLSRHTPL